MLGLPPFIVAASLAKAAGPANAQDRDQDRDQDRVEHELGLFGPSRTIDCIL
jgi:hypothetical protein